MTIQPPQPSSGKPQTVMSWPLKGCLGCLGLSMVGLVALVALGFAAQKQRIEDFARNKQQVLSDMRSAIAAGDYEKAAKIGEPFKVVDDAEFKALLNESIEKAGKNEVEKTAKTDAEQERAANGPIAANTAEPPAKKPTKCPTVIEKGPATGKAAVKPFVIMKDDKLGSIRRSVDVRLDGKITTDDIAKIANAIRDGSSQKFERTFIVYYLPGQQVDAGGWATSHFDPELKVQILGLAESPANAAPAMNPGEREIGQWEYQAPPGFVVVIVQSGNNYTLRRTYQDGSSSVEAVQAVKVGDQVKITPVKKNEFGEYWIMGADKNLRLMDAQGPIGTALRR